ncbi:hypothetical protein AKO1_007964 [Acrasis kona]|uniref:Major facilitator superfamily (MFS) profile domain-containing protein n=1 Tax=Acrasis kona TaxID=1008807 RepID=A0AAW2YP04_9EUKA
MLTVFSLAGLLCSLYQFTFAAIQDAAMRYYRIEYTQLWKLNLMSLSYMIAYVPSALVASYIIDKKGLRLSVTIGCMLNFLSGWVRLAGFKKGHEYFYWISFSGQCLGALAQPFLTNAITSMASNWFGEKERTIATTIGAFTNILGGGIAFGVAPPLATIASRNGRDISEIGMVILLSSQALFASLLLLLCVSTFRERPPTPPSSSFSSSHNVKHEVRQDLLSLAKNRDFVILFIAFGLGFGSFQAFTSLINQIVVPVGYNDDDAGIMGLAIIACGLVGAGIFGISADLTKRYKTLLMICGVLSAVSFTCFCVAIMYQKTTTTYWLCIAAICSMGLTATAIVPLALEAAVEVTYPIAETLSNGLLYAAGTLCSIAILLAMSFMQPQIPDPIRPGRTLPGSMQNALWVALGCFCTAILMIPFFGGLKPKYKRYEQELIDKEGDNHVLKISLDKSFLRYHERV